MKDKPFALNYEEAKQLIYNSVNRAHSEFGVPFYMLNTIIMAIQNQVDTASKGELASIRSYYEAGDEQNKEQEKEEKAEK